MSLAAVVALLVTFSPTVYWSVDLFKDLKDIGTDANGAVTKLLAIILSFVVLSLYAHSRLDLGGSGKFVSGLPWQALLLGAWVFASTGGLISDQLRARNISDTSVKSRLLAFRKKAA